MEIINILLDTIVAIFKALDLGITDVLDFGSAILSSTTEGVAAAD